MNQETDVDRTVEALSAKEEVAVLDQCRRRDHDSNAGWDRLITAYEQPLINFIFRLDNTLEEEDAQDQAQITFVRAVRSIDSFKGQSSFKTWLFGISRHVVSEERTRREAGKRGGGLRQSSLETPVGPADNPSGTLEDVIADPDSLSPQEELVRKEDCKTLTRGLGKLEEACKEIIELVCFGELSYDEAARALKLNPKTVSSRLSRCKKELGRLIEQNREH